MIKTLSKPGTEITFLNLTRGISLNHTHTWTYWGPFKKQNKKTPKKHKVNIKIQT